MGASSIEWTKKVWNPVTGCDKVSAGCKFCYAETFSERWRGIKGHPYEQGFDLKLWPDRLDIPLGWKKGTKIFVNSMSDLFHKDVPEPFIDSVFRTMSRAPQHTFQILTKLADRMQEYCSNRWGLIGEKNWAPLPNVWLGVSVENQEAADERIPLLLKTPAAVRWISAEPLLGPLDLIGKDPQGSALHKYEGDAKLDWVVVGGESGHGARPFNIAWARSIKEQCQEAGVAVFVKQLGRRIFWDGCTVKWPNRRTLSDGSLEGENGWWVRLKEKKGGDMAEWPPELRVREFPR